MKPKYQAIVLVLSSDDDCIKNTHWDMPRMKPEWEPLFPYFKHIWTQYMYSEPNIKVLFVYGNSQVPDAQDYDMIYPDVIDDNWPGMITKTLYAMRDIDQQYNYNFLIRTNLSTFWDLNKLSKRLDQLPCQKCLTGTEVKFQDRKNKQYHYISGFDMVMSRDLIQAILPYIDDIISKKAFLNMEDLALCTAFKEYYDIEIENFGDNHQAVVIGMREYHEKDYQKALVRQKDRNLDHFRIKSRMNRNIDKLIHQKLLNDIYGKTLL
jgi:hypothetical protein